MTHDAVDTEALTVFQRERISCVLCGHFLADAPATRTITEAELLACAPTCPSSMPAARTETWPATPAEVALLATLIAAVALALLIPPRGPHTTTAPGPYPAAACSTPT